jgi:hypothetical protein
LKIFVEKLWESFLIKFSKSFLYQGKIKNNFKKLNKKFLVLTKIILKSIIEGIAFNKKINKKIK